MAEAAEDADRRIGLIAGYGMFPVELAREMKRAGFTIHAAAVREETGPEIEQVADSVCWLHVGQVGGMIKAFRQAGVRDVVMAGKVRKLHLFRNFRPDWMALKGLMRLKDRRDDTILNVIAGLMAEEGLHLIEQTRHAGAMLAREGWIAGPKQAPAPDEIAFGMAQARGIAALDIGQTIVVKDKAVLAVEAIEGSDAAIRRGGALGGGDAIVFKVAKPEQDLRFDVPAVGPDTLVAMHESGCSRLVVEAGMTLLIERERLARMAGELGIGVFGARLGGKGAEGA
ncbi:MAG: UDP-2,3-diacylglucosamine diphosphatase LpxI [Mariprofundaceae bacterium]